MNILFYVLFLAMPCGTQDLSYPMRDSFIYIYYVFTGLHCCMWAFSNCGEQGLLFILAASVISEHRFWVQAPAVLACGL